MGSLATKQVTKRRRSKKRKTVYNRAPTAMQRARISIESHWTLNDYKASWSAVMTFQYLNFNCNTDDGTMHRFSIRQIAESHSWSNETASNAIAELISLGLIEVNVDNPIGGTIPQQAFMTQQARLENAEKPERNFYKKLRKEIDKRGGEDNLSKNKLVAIFTNLVKQEAEARRFHPKEDRIANVLDRLRYFEGK